VVDDFDGEVYGMKIAEDDPDDDDGSMPAIEVMDVIDGETICYIEAETMDQCLAIARDAEIEVQE
jgi:hypothetical protein